jgi:predicted dehydrogenase
LNRRKLFFIRFEFRLASLNLTVEKNDIPMVTRRAFIEKTGKGLAYTTMALSTPAPAKPGPAGKPPETIRIGIIGAENSHTIGFGKLFNIDKKFEGLEVKYVWGETDELARKASERGKIPHIVSRPEEMLGKIDALIVDHRHARYHLEAATPFIKAGIPSFIDKPFCYRMEEGRDFLAMAREYGTPVTSFSSIAHSEATFDMIEQLKEIEKVHQVVRLGRADFDSVYGGIFFYGVHLLQPLMYMFGDEIEKVKVTRTGTKGNITLTYRDGLTASLILNRKVYGWKTYLETDEGIRELTSRIDPPQVDRNYTDMVEMFRTGKEPRSHESILRCVAVLEAIEQSGQTEAWVEVAS